MVNGTYGETRTGSPNAVAFDAVDSSLVDMTAANQAKYRSAPVHPFVISSSLSWTYLESTYAIKNKVSLCKEG